MKHEEQLKKLKVLHLEEKNCRIFAELPCTPKGVPKPPDRLGPALDGDFQFCVTFWSLQRALPQRQARLEGKGHGSGLAADDIQGPWLEDVEQTSVSQALWLGQKDLELRAAPGKRAGSGLS